MKDPTAILSQSNIGMWLGDCPQKWAYIYVHGLRRPPAVALEYGKAWDETISGDDGFWDQTMRLGRHPTAGQARDLFASKWDEHKQEVIDWGNDDPSSLLDIGTMAAGIWTERVGSIHIPHALQKRFQFAVSTHDNETFSLNGIIDTTLLPRDTILGVKPRATLHDDKTAKQSWISKTGPNAGKPNKKAVASLQTAAYTLGASVDPELKDQVNLDTFVFDVHVKTKTPQIQTVEVPVSQESRNDYLRLAEAVRAQQKLAIKMGYFTPNRSSNMCSKRWCPFWAECVKEHGGEICD